MDTPIASNCATVVAAAGAYDASQPSTLIVLSDPVIAGAVLSSTLMVCVAVLAFPQPSVTVYVLVITKGHVPALASECVTTRLASDVHASEILTPIASICATVVAAEG